MSQKNKQKGKGKPDQKSRYTGRAGMVALGLILRAMKFFDPIIKRVKINQKRVKDTPVDKLIDALMCILLGVKGLVEINTRVRSEEGMYRAFGRARCAEQSVVQETLDASTGKNVEELEAATREMYQQHSRAVKHDVRRNGKLVLDVDLTGKPCGKKAECATKGYFAGERNRSGRQVGRVIATQYEDIVVDQLFEGKQSLYGGVESLMLAAEKVLGLDEADREHVMVRLDAGGGTMACVNWLLRRGYQVITKDFSGKRAQKLAGSVKEWVEDKQHPGRQMGEITEPAEYEREVKRIAVRCPKKNGEWAVGILITTLSARDVMQLARQPIDGIRDERKVLCAAVAVYDQRGGGVELSFKQDKQGLKIGKRNKKRFAAQQMVMLLEMLAHNLLIWARDWLSPHAPRLAKLGIVRFVRDVLQTSGNVIFATKDTIERLILNKAAPYARDLEKSFSALLKRKRIAIVIQKI